MFEYQQPNLDRKEPTDYTGPKIVAILAPVFFLFAYLGKAEMGFTVVLVLGMVIFAVKLRWKLRKHIWFWCAIAFIFTLHIPLLFIVRWPHSNIPTIVYSFPLAAVDFVLVMGSIRLAQNVFSKSSSDDKDE